MRLLKGVSLGLLLWAEKPSGHKLQSSHRRAPNGFASPYQRRRAHNISRHSRDRRQQFRCSYTFSKFYSYCRHLFRKHHTLFELNQDQDHQHLGHHHVLSETDSDEKLVESEQLETDVQETELKLMAAKKETRPGCHMWQDGPNKGVPSHLLGKSWSHRDPHCVCSIEIRISGEYFSELSTVFYNNEASLEIPKSMEADIFLQRNVTVIMTGNCEYNV